MGVPCRTILVTVTVSLVGTMQLGYHHAVYNQPELVLQQVLNKSYSLIGHKNPDRQTLLIFWSFIISSFAMGFLFGGVSGSIAFVDRAGRKEALKAAALIGVIGCVLRIFAFRFQETTLYLLPISRFINGIGVGIGTNAQAVFVSEIAPTNSRGTLGALAPVFQAFGTLLANLVGRPSIFGNSDQWWLLAVVSASISILFYALSYFFYESPKYLVSTGHENRAAQTSVNFYNDWRTDTEEVLDNIRLEARETEGIGGLFDLLAKHRGFRKALRVAYCVAFLIPTSGIFLMFSYLSDVARAAGMQQKFVSIISIAYPSLDVVFSLIGTLLIDRIGRRRILVTGSWLIIFCLSVICLCQVLIDFGYKLEIGLRIVLFGAILAHVATKAVCINGVAYVLPYELFPTAVRGSVASYVVSLGMGLGDVILLFAYLPLKHYIGGFSLLILFVLPLILIAIVLSSYTPETMGQNVLHVVTNLTRSEEAEAAEIGEAKVIDIPSSPEEQEAPWRSSYLRHTSRQFTEGEDLRPSNSETVPLLL